MDDKDQGQVLEEVLSGVFNCQFDAVIERVYLQVNCYIYFFHVHMHETYLDKQSASAMDPAIE